MTIKHRIHWTALQTGKTGHGNPVFDDLKEALRVVKEANKKHNTIHHWVESFEVQEREEDDYPDRGDPLGELALAAVVGYDGPIY